ncbi:MAG: dockerin type I domain-containing protein, partial [Chitinophagales bacterium]
TDACSGANIRFKYLLFLDLDGNGSMETVVNSNNAPGYPFPVYNNVQYNNINTQNYLGGESRAFDFRPVPSNQKWGFGIQTDAPSGNNRTARVRWVNLAGQNTVPQLPYGTHKIKWFVEDGCGNETVVDQEFIVKDCKKPTVVCLNGLSVNLMNVSGGMVSLFASDFLQYTEDNCTPSNQLTIAIRRSGTGTGFPVTSTGAPQTEVQFTCADLGTQLVELWSIDKAGNADYCETYVLVQDNAGICGPVAGMATVAGALETEAAQGVEDANIELNGSSNGTPVLSEVFSNVSGSYLFSNALPIAANATVTPIHDVDPLNGVNTWDLVLISRHILGLDPLSSPYKLIAADANKSGTVTTFDIVELRKLILGTYTALPNNNSWRLVDASQQFTNNDNPFADVIRENLQIAAIQNNILNGDFVGVKVGDVDGTATPNTLTSSDDRTAGTLLFDVADRKVVAGEEFTVHFKAAEQVSAYQFTLNFRNLEVLEVIPGAKQTMENFGIFNNAITTSADATPGEFAVKFRATANGTLSQQLSVSSQITKAVAFEANNKLDVAIRFNGANTTISTVGFELYQNSPNPWVSKTQIGFHLPEATEARLTIYDALGRILYTAKGQFAKGYNVFTVDRKLVDSTSTLYYSVETDDKRETKLMLQLK